MVKPIYEVIDNTIYVPKGCSCGSDFNWGSESELVFEGDNGIIIERKDNKVKIKIDENFIIDQGGY